MKTLASLLKTCLGVALPICVLLLGHPAFAAVSFSISPAATSNQYSGYLTLTISNLPASGATVLVKKFADLNSNGVVDASDFLLQQFQISDGQGPSLFSAKTNVNIPYDLNPAASNIITQLSPATEGIAQRLTGQYLFVVSSPTSLFTPITNIFNITNYPYAQWITGKVITGSSNIPNAYVLLAGPPGGDGLNLIGGALADSTGTYLIKTTPGTYQLFASQSNFIFNAATAPVVTLTAGSPITTNIFLTNGTRTVSGKLVDAANASLGLPAVLLAAQSTNNYIAFGVSDSTGSFTLPAIPGQVSLGTDQQPLNLLGYVGLNNNLKVDATAGNITGASIAFPQATAMIYGSIKDNNNNPLPGVRLSGDNDTNGNGAYQGDATTDPNGNYAIGVVAGLWSPGIDNKSTALIYPGYIFSQGPPWTFNNSGGGSNITAGMAVKATFSAILASNQITGYIKDNNNQPIVGVQVNGSAVISGTNYQSQQLTDTNGNYVLLVANGNWSVNVNCSGDNNSLDSLGSYQCPNSTNALINNGNATVNFTVQNCNGVQITTKSLPGGQVGSFYDAFLQGASCTGNLNWSLNDPQNFPSALTLSSNGEIFGNPDTAGTYNFSVHVDDGNSHTTNQSLSLTVQPATVDVATYYVTKAQNFLQSGPSTPVPDANFGQFTAYLGIIQSSLGVVSIANVTLPTSNIKGFPSGNSALELQVHDTFSSQSAFDAAYPSGTYSFSISTQDNGNQFPVLNLPVPTYPSTPHINNYPAAQTINPNNPFLLQWDAYIGGTTNDSIWLFINDTNGTQVFSSPYPGTNFNASLKGNVTSASIPAATLQAGRAYTGVLIFFRSTSSNTNGYPGAFGVTDVESKTAFNLAALSATPILTQASRPSTNQFRFLLSGLSGQNYTFQVSTNLAATNWTTLYVTNNASSNSFFLVDTNASNTSRFYRVLVY